MPTNLIRKEFIANKKDLFYYITPIIAYLLLCWHEYSDKPTNLDDLLTETGIKHLIKSVKVSDQI